MAQSSLLFHGCDRWFMERVLEIQPPEYLRLRPYHDPHGLQVVVTSPGDATMPIIDPAINYCTLEILSADAVDIAPQFFVPVVSFLLKAKERYAPTPDLYLCLLCAFKPHPLVVDTDGMVDVPRESWVVTQIAAGCMYQDPWIVWRVMDVLAGDFELKHDFAALVPEDLRKMADVAIDVDVDATRLPSWHE